MPYPTLLPNTTWYKSAVQRSSITQINIVDRYTPNGSEDESWNADVDNTGSIKCYRAGTVIIIAGNGSGKIYANEDSSCMFANTSSDRFSGLTSIIGADTLDTSKTTTFEYMFDRAQNLSVVDVSSWDTSSVTSMKAIFQGCISIVELDLSGWDVSKVETMQGMFMSASSLGAMSLTSIGNVSGWDVRKVTSVQAMFQWCRNLQKLDLSGWRLTACTVTKNMFNECRLLETIGDVSEWDVGNVKDFSNMFQYCKKLQSLNTGKWDTSSATNMDNVFYYCGSLSSLDTSSWDTGNVTSMKYMLDGCNALEKIRLGTNFSFTGSDHNLPTPASGYWYDIDKEPFAPTAIPNGAGTYFSSTAVADREAAEPMLVTQGSLLKTAKAIRAKTEETTGYKPSEFPDAIRSIVGGELTSGSVPAGANVKYIIPATYAPLRTSDGFGFDAFQLTFTRENTNQLFYVLWRLQDVADFTTPGFWISTISWDLTQQGNYNSQHNLFVTVQGAGKGGNLTPTSTVSNVAKSAITASISVAALKGSGESYARLGQLYKGLIVVTDSTYTGEPIVDGAKLGQYFGDIDTLTAGWGE